MKRFGLIAILAIIFLIGIVSAYTDVAPDVDVEDDIVGDLSNKEAALEARELLEDNLKYAENKDVEGYISTITADAQEDTRKAMAEFFEDYTVEHELISFEVLEQTDNRLAASTQQKTVGTSHVSDEDYRDHIATGLHVFIKEQGEWRISESSMTDMQFID